ncbi:MAG: iron ABC transporter permease [Paracoccus sp. (in: a-proteobacteria)]|nr:iron ABC transporter permease [Paracoccus sp. (in: a-proteobacteria)]
MVLPAFWLVVRAFSAEPAQLGAIVFRMRNLVLLGNTLQLVGLVLAMGTAIALPLAWLVTQSDLRHRKVLSFLSVLPLAIPGYVMAYALLGLSGYYGFAQHYFGLRLPRLDGLWGAALALTLYTFPYMFLNLRAAFMGLDPAQAETARSLGHSAGAAFRRITWPQIRPALYSGWLIVGLYVIGDFGVIALMRYEVFSFAIYTQYSGAFDRTYAAWLSLMLLALTVAAIQIHAHATRGLRLARTGTGTARRAVPVRLGRWRVLVWLFVAAVLLASLGLPVMVLSHWMRLGVPGFDWLELAATLGRTVMVAAPAALIAVALGLPVVLLVLRYPSGFGTTMERLSYIGYATPPLAFALAMVFFSLQVAPFIYQSFGLLIFAYVMSFLALTIGPIRLALLQIGTRQEEAARALGASPGRAFRRVVLPRLRPSLVAGGLLVFIMVVKELPMTFLLAPTGYSTLAMTVFSRTSEGMMREAAPFAAVIILFSSLFIGLIMKYEGSGRPGASNNDPTR